MLVFDEPSAFDKKMTTENDVLPSRERGYNMKTNSQLVLSLEFVGCELCCLDRPHRDIS